MFIEKMVFCVFLACCLSGTVSAGDFTWNAGNGDWQVASFWVPFVPPNIIGPPGLGDTAAILSDVNVGLSADVLGLEGLVLANDADLFPADNQLTITTINGTGVANINGIGFTGGNTTMFVFPHVGGSSVIADNINLANGGELNLNAGATVQVNQALDVDGISLISGSGTIVFRNGPVGSRLDLRGEIRPDGESTIELVAESGTLDLDGGSVPGGLRRLNLLDDGAGLRVDGAINDSLRTQIDMGPRSSLRFEQPWDFGGSTGGPINIDAAYAGGDNPAIISGAKMTFGQANAILNVDSGRASIASEAVFHANSQVTVAEGASLSLAGDETTFRGGSWAGAGEIGLHSPLTRVAEATTVDMPDGTFNLDGSGSGTLALDAPLRLNVDRIDDAGSFVSNSIQINGAGQLHVNMSDADFYSMGGELELNGPVFGTGVHLAGERVVLFGTTTVTNSSASQSDIDFRGDMNITASSELNLQSSFNVIRSFASITGEGELIVRPTAELHVHDTATVGVDLVNLGRLEPGVFPTDFGSVTIDGNFSQSAQGVLDFDIAGPPGTIQDFVDVTQFAFLGGELAATFDDTIPAEGDVYPILRAAGVSGAPGIQGTFDSLSIAISNPLFDIGDANLIYTGTDVFLRVDDLLMMGDFNDNLMLGCEDVDALVAEIASGGGNLDFDLTGDGLVTLADLDEWLEIAGTLNVGGTYLGGDANLDGVVDGVDFVIWNGNKFTSTPAWCSGDFNADGFVDGADFVIWNDNKFMNSFAAAVPEPAHTPFWPLVVSGALLRGILTTRNAG